MSIFSNYSTPDTSHCAHQGKVEIKKSRFIALAKHITHKAEAKAWLVQVKADYADARHHCWAYLLGNPHNATQAGMGDDGEPSGTAGKPILNVLQHKGVGDIMVIVVRYFGGIKLGAGGLTRAYAQATQAVMETLPVRPFLATETLDLQLDFSAEQRLRHWLTLHDGELLGLDYGQGQLPVRACIQLPSTETVAFLARLEGRQDIVLVNPDIS